MVDIANTYFNDGLYLRIGPDGQWKASVELGSPWRPADDREVPDKLKAKNKTKGKKNPFR